MVTERQLQEAIQYQVLYGGRLGTNLYELGFITEERLQEALARAHGVPSVALDLRCVDPEVVNAVPKKLAAKHKVFPYRIKGKTLTLLMVNPADHGAVAEVGYTLGYIVKPLVVPELRMIQLLHDYYGVDERWRYTDTRRAEAPVDSFAASCNSCTVHASAREDPVSADEVVDAVLALSLRYFRRVVFFIVREPWVLGWSGLGEGMDRTLASSLRIPLDQPSVFRGVSRDKTVFIGRFPPEEENQRFLKTLGKRANTNAALLPVALKGRVVNLIYGDNGASGQVKPDLGDLIVLVQKIPRAYLRIIRKRVAEAEPAAVPTPNPEETNE